MRRKFASVTLPLTLIMIMFVSNNVLSIGNALEMPVPILFPRVYVDFPFVILPSKTKVNVSETFTAYIKIEEFENLWGFEFKLCWERSKVELIRHSCSVPWVPCVIVNDEITYNDTHGQWHFGASAISPSPPFTGNFTIAEFVFVCMGPGETILDLKDTLFMDINGREIQHWVYDGVVFQVGPLEVSISPASSLILMGESVKFTSNVSGGEPPYSYQWYLNGNLVPNATAESWTFYPQTVGNFTIYLIVKDKTLQTAQSNQAWVNVAPKLTVSISPMSASTLVGKPVTFTSNVSGGYPPYTYQWFLNGNPVYGATLSTWTFTPTTSGIFYVHLKVTDAQGYTAQSEASRIIASTVPVGGYSVSIQNCSEMWLFFTYTALLVTLTALFIRIRQKQRKK